MKRSEMIKEIQTLVYMANAEDLCISEEEANYILKGLEAKGMLPPDSTGTVFGYNEGFISPPEWEPEEDRYCGAV